MNTPGRQQRTPSRWARYCLPELASAILCVAVAGCTAHRLPETTGAPSVPQAEAPPRPAPRHPASKTVQAHWLGTGDATCPETARLKASNLTIILRQPKLSEITISLALLHSRMRSAHGKKLSLTFQNKQTKWDVKGRLKDKQVAFTLPSNAESLSKILVLMSGGTLHLRSPRVKYLIQVPPAGPSEQRWFDCARIKVVG